jgi:hypothetical protein
MSVNLKKAIKDIKKAGFTHFKVELEAQLNRGDSDGEVSYEDCAECDGRGYLHLFTAAGVEVDETTECTDCYGEGSVEIEVDDFSVPETCQAYIKDHISQEAREAINFMYFYNDGSVDSEITYTLPIDNPQYALEVIEAFKSLADEIGNGIDVEGAGMHVSVLTSSDYPSYSRLPSANINNFKREVAKLLPALYVAATSGDFTRGIGYRDAMITSDTKYSAIYTHGDTCLEYRLFETCYQRPEALYEYLGVIARTLEYYVDPSKRVTYTSKNEEKSALGTEFPIYGQAGLKGFTELPEQVEVIKKQFKHVQPAGVTMKQFMEQRKINLSLTKARKNLAQRSTKIKTAYQEHKKAYEFNRNITLTPYQEDNILYYRREYPSWDEDRIWARVTGFPLLQDEETFLRNNISTSSPARTLSV